MFHRLIIEDTTAIVTLAAFITAASIFLTFAWRAIRMRPDQTDRFAKLPFETETPAARHEPDA